MEPTRTRIEIKLQEYLHKKKKINFLGASSLTAEHEMIPMEFAGEMIQKNQLQQVTFHCHEIYTTVQEMFLNKTATQQSTRRTVEKSMQTGKS